MRMLLTLYAVLGKQFDVERMSPASEVNKASRNVFGTKYKLQREKMIIAH